MCLVDHATESSVKDANDYFINGLFGRDRHSTEIIFYRVRSSACCFLFVRLFAHVRDQNGVVLVGCLPRRRVRSNGDVIRSVAHSLGSPE